MKKRFCFLSIEANSNCSIVFTCIFLALNLVSCSNKKSNVTDLNWVAEEKNIVFLLKGEDHKFNSKLFTSDKKSNKKLLVLNRYDFNYLDSIISLQQSLNNQYPTRSYLFLFDKPRNLDTLDIYKALGLARHSDMPSKALWYEYFDIVDEVFAQDSSIACVSYPMHCEAENTIYHYKGNPGDPYVITITCDTSSLIKGLKVKDELLKKLNKMANSRE